MMKIKKFATMVLAATVLVGAVPATVATPVAVEAATKAPALAKTSVSIAYKDTTLNSEKLQKYEYVTVKNGKIKSVKSSNSKKVEARRDNSKTVKVLATRTAGKANVTVTLTNGKKLTLVVKNYGTKVPQKKATLSFSKNAPVDKKGAIPTVYLNDDLLNTISSIWVDNGKIKSIRSSISLKSVKYISNYENVVELYGENIPGEGTITITTTRGEKLVCKVKNYGTLDNLKVTGIKDGMTLKKGDSVKVSVKNCPTEYKIVVSNNLKVDGNEITLGAVDWDFAYGYAEIQVKYPDTGKFKPVYYYSIDFVE